MNFGNVLRNKVSSGRGFTGLVFVRCFMCVGGEGGGVDPLLLVRLPHRDVRSGCLPAPLTSLPCQHCVLVY